MIFTAILLYFCEARSIGYRYDEFGVLLVGNNVAPRDTTGEGAYEDVGILKISRRYCCMHEDTLYCY